MPIIAMTTRSSISVNPLVFITLLPISHSLVTNSQGSWIRKRDTLSHRYSRCNPFSRRCESPPSHAASPGNLFARSHKLVRVQSPGPFRGLSPEYRLSPPRYCHRLSQMSRVFAAPKSARRKMACIHRLCPPARLSLRGRHACRAVAPCTQPVWRGHAHGHVEPSSLGLGFQRQRWAIPGAKSVF